MIRGTSCVVLRSRTGLRLLLLAVALVLGSLPAGAQQQVLVEARSTMRYLANAGNPSIGMAWTAPAFDDSAWPTGRFGVGYDQLGDATQLLETLVAPGAVSIFTRATFTISDVSTVESLWLGADYDDGFVAWLNGHEIYRSPSMPGGPLSWDTQPLAHESTNGLDPGYEPLIDLSATGLPHLQVGANVLALGVWNVGAGSSDLVLVPLVVTNPAFSLVRGPYLQGGTSTSVRIRWRTATSQSSRVVFGTAVGALNSMVSDGQARVEHELLLAGLAPNTRYYYAIGDMDTLLVGGDEQHSFVTAPATGTPDPTRIWVVGDSGTADAASRDVRDAYLDGAGANGTDLWLMLGDNAYPAGTDEEYQAAVFDVYPRLLRQTVLWPTIGNHDVPSSGSGTQTAPYFDIFSLPASGEAGGLASGTEAYYSFDHANVHFVVLDSQGSDRSPPPAGAMLTWLESDLAATAQEWIIAFWHHPPYSDGLHKSDTELELVEMRQNAVPLLESHGVDLVLAGHSHSYERSFLIDGHYGMSTTFGPGYVIDGGSGREHTPDGAYTKPAGLVAHEGAVYAVAGSSGLVSPASLLHPVMFSAAATLGSLVLDVDGGRLDAKFVDATGAVIDYFTILKGFHCPAGPDADSDGACDDVDNCPALSNPLQADDDGDGLGDGCDPCPGDPANDPDGDGVCQLSDNCPGQANPGQADADADGLGDGCDACPVDPLNDADADGLCQEADNCPGVANPGQADADADGVGDACDPCPTASGNDVDGDGICVDLDNCPTVANAAQLDADADGSGDLCDACPLDATNDGDGDGVCENQDNCPGVSNPNQADADLDTLGDACDACQADPDNDLDGDGICAEEDNCPGSANADQADADGDGIGNACDLPGDLDGDGVPDAADNCPGLVNPGQQNADGDGEGNVCDADDDGDAVPDLADCAPLSAAASAIPPAIGATLRIDKTAGTTLRWIGVAQGHVSNVYRALFPSTAFACLDIGHPGLASVQPDAPAAGSVYLYLVSAANLCGESSLGADSTGASYPAGSPCPQSNADGDGDGWTDASDNCALLAEPSLADADHDFRGDVCDNCPTVSNGEQADGDGNGRGDACEHLVDQDDDGIEDAADNCPQEFNTTQSNSDLDAYGDLCDACPTDPANDTDADGWCAAVDNCPSVANPAQVDADGDGAGDGCDGCPSDADKLAPGACGCGVPQCWTAQSSGVQDELHGVDFRQDGTGYAVGDGGTIVRTANGGASWTVLSSGTGQHLFDVQFPLGAASGYVVGRNGVILRTVNGGTSWTPQVSGTGVDLYGVHFPLDAATGYAVGENGTIRKTVNGGANWSALPSGTNGRLRAVHFPTETIGYVVGDSGTIRKTTNGGASWTLQSSGTEEHLFAVHFPSASSGIAVGDKGIILRTTNGGANWTVVVAVNGNTLLGVHFPTESIGYAVGENGTVRKTTNGGITWSGQSSGTSSTLFGVHFANGVDGIVAGKNGVIRRSRP